MFFFNIEVTPLSVAVAVSVVMASLILLCIGSGEQDFKMLLAMSPEVDFSDRRLDTAKIAAMAEALADNDTATSLTLGHAGIDDAGAAALAEGLRGNRTLKKVNLHDNAIGSAGMAALADALFENDALETLGLNSNALGDNGAASLAALLEGNASLTAVWAGGNGILRTGAEALASALRSNHTLRTLDVRGKEEGEGFGDGGAKALAAALESDNRTLTTLWHGGNGITAAVRTVLDGRVRRNKDMSSKGSGALFFQRKRSAVSSVPI